VDELGLALDAFEADENIGCIVITGNEKPSPPAPTSAS
jgi:enoyl-CoA hydratase